jgi:hypothetical protein
LIEKGFIGAGQFLPPDLVGQIKIKLTFTDLFADVFPGVRGERAQVKTGKINFDIGKIFLAQGVYLAADYKGRLLIDFAFKLKSGPTFCLGRKTGDRSVKFGETGPVGRLDIFIQKLDLGVA